MVRVMLVPSAVTVAVRIGGRGADRLQEHAALRAVARAYLPHLWVHGTGVLRVLCQSDMLVIASMIVLMTRLVLITRWLFALHVLLLTWF
jgi:hypothetical protein